MIQGSSPHARGLQAAGEEALAPVGIIPARAGFTARHYPYGIPDPDHPRTRRVYTVIHDIKPGPGGSSPHAQGLPLAILGIPTVLESTTPRFPSLLT